MKQKTLKYILCVSVILSAAFVGCLKDTAYDNHQIQSVRPDGSENVVYVGLTATSNDNHLQMAFENSSNDTTFDAVPIILAAGEVAPEDIKVTLSVNPALLGSYNDINGTTHAEAPTSLYTVTSGGDSATGYVVTIPKGQNTGYLQLKIKPSDFLGYDYALGLQITSVSAGYLISTNFNTGILAIGVKNQYDGVYSYKGYSLRAGDPTLTGYFSDKEMSLITSGVNSVAFGSFALWGDGNSGIAIGFPNLTVNSDNSVTIESDLGASNAPGYDSHYDPDTRTFYIGFTWGAGPSSRLSTDTLTWLRPR